MIIIACVDDNMGMMFNSRRQSRDRILRKRILEMTEGKKLWMSEYSSALFSDCVGANIVAADSFLENAAEGEYCFLEDKSALKYSDSIEKIVLFKWNRKYPADFYFDIPLEEQGWKISAASDFSGSSHEKITEEVYIK